MQGENKKKSKKVKNVTTEKRNIALNERFTRDKHSDQRKTYE